MAVRAKKKRIIEDILEDALEELNLTGRYAIPFSYCKTSTNTTVVRTPHGIVLKHITKPNTF